MTEAANQTLSPFERILAKAHQQPQRIVLAEGEDGRVQEAALKASKDGIARPILVGDRERIGAALEEAGAAEDAVSIADPAQSERLERYAELYHDLRKHKGVDEAKSLEAARQPLNFAALMVRADDADGSIGGAVETTAATVRTALQVIGVAEGVQTVSSFFLMLPGKQTQADAEAMIFTDCALVIEPNRDQLVDIAISSAESCRRMLGSEPRVALLSFSTAGSGRHARVETVSAAAKAIAEREPSLCVDGELQFDAAMVPDVAQRKAPDSPVEGRANVFVFPNLDAGNIGYKIAQRLGGMSAVGPILQGLRQPANDLSRGCTTDDVYALLAVTSLQAQSQA